MQQYATPRPVRQSDIAEILEGLAEVEFLENRLVLDTDRTVTQRATILWRGAGILRWAEHRWSNHDSHWRTGHVGRGY